jgi:hypothetical protein
MPSVIIKSITLNVVMLNVVAPDNVLWLKYVGEVYFETGGQGDGVGDGDGDGQATRCKIAAILVCVASPKLVKSSSFK